MAKSQKRSGWMKKALARKAPKRRTWIAFLGDGPGPGEGCVPTSTEAGEGCPTIDVFGAIVANQVLQDLYTDCVYVRRIVGSIHVIPGWESTAAAQQSWLRWAWMCKVYEISNAAPQGIQTNMFDQTDWSEMKRVLFRREAFQFAAPDVAVDATGEDVETTLSFPAQTLLLPDELAGCCAPMAPIIAGESTGAPCAPCVTNPSGFMTGFVAAFDVTGTATSTGGASTFRFAPQQRLNMNWRGNVKLSESDELQFQLNMHNLIPGGEQPTGITMYSSLRVLLEY